MESTPAQVCTQLLSLIGRIKLEMMRLAEDYELTSMQFQALHMLDQHGEMPMGQFARLLHCDPSNITGVVDRLVAHKLVDRRDSPADRRTKTISLTAEGKDIVSEIKRLLPQRIDCDKLTPQEREALLATIQKLAV